MSLLHQEFHDVISYLMPWPMPLCCPAMAAHSPSCGSNLDVPAMQPEHPTLPRPLTQAPSFRAVLFKLNPAVDSCRQDAPHCASVSFDRHAANSFQAYNQQALAFSIKRGGILYGNKDEEGNVQVHAIFEPQQVGTATYPGRWQQWQVSPGGTD